MIDRVNALGERQAGFMMSLLPVLGLGSFKDAPRAHWLAPLLGSDTRMGREFHAAWRAMQRE
eukprot:909014-Karenia_brevis.AAC.1